MEKKKSVILPGLSRKSSLFPHPEFSFPKAATLIYFGWFFCHLRLYFRISHVDNSFLLFQFLVSSVYFRLWERGFAFLYACFVPPPPRNTLTLRASPGQCYHNFWLKFRAHHNSVFAYEDNYVSVVYSQAW